MAKLNINIGGTPNDKINQNFTELYARTGDDIQIPTLSGNSGKILSTNGTTLSWVTIDGGTATTTF